MAWNLFRKKSAPADPALQEDLTESRAGEPSKEMGIHLLYSTLNANNEQRGYDDALVNADASNLEQGKDILKNDLLRKIDEIKVYYSDFLREIDFHIESRRTSAMYTTVEELRMRKEIAEGHLQKVLQIEEECRNGQLEQMGVIVTYVRGFQKGLAALSFTNMNKYHH